MAIFSMFTGMIYNDLFSKGMHFFHTGWEWPSVVGNSTVEAIPNGHTYLFGVDPTWHGAENALVFINSYKMKMSIILGVIHVCPLQLTKLVLTALQMTFAICLQLPNHLHFKNTLSIWTEFIPQIIFFHSIFGYLVIMVIAKWSTDWTQATTQPPNLLNMLIYMFLQPGEVEPSEQMYAGQGMVQKVLLYIALVCVPWMLVVKPYILWREHKKITKDGYQGVAGGEHEPLARGADDAMLEGEEEGEGHALLEDIAEEHVSPFHRTSRCVRAESSRSPLK